MKKTRRSTQIGDMIRTELAVIFQREMSDPDLGFVTITEVEVAPDMRFARVYVSTLGGPEQEAKTLAALKKSAARARYLLAQRARMRYTPDLDFRLDTTLARAGRIEEILHQVLPPKKEAENDEERVDEPDSEPDES